MVVASLGDERRSPGRACIVPSSISQALVKADCFRFRLDESIALSEFVAMQLNSLCRPFFQFTAKGTTRQRVTITDVRRCPIAIPSLDEQRRVVATVTAEQQEVTSLIAHVEQELTLLADLRAATITDAILGRIEVRQYMKS
jgi:type I restriction enzyme S subunit